MPRPAPKTLDSRINVVKRIYLKNARKRDLSFTLDHETFKTLILSKCSYCGSPPSNKSTDSCGNYSFNYTGIDRIDSSKGYEINNCVSCCVICNSAKMTRRYEDYLNWIRNLVNFRLKKEPEFYLGEPPEV